MGAWVTGTNQVGGAWAKELKLLSSELLIMVDVEEESAW